MWWTKISEWWWLWCTFHWFNQKQNKIWATIYHQTTPWDKAKYLRKLLHPWWLVNGMFLLVPSLKWACHVPCGQIALPRNNFSAEILGLSSSKCTLQSGRETYSIAKKKEREWDKMFGFICHCFLKLYASTPNSCLYLPLYHSINCYCSRIVLEVWTDSTGIIGKGVFYRYDLQLWPCYNVFLT